MNWAEWVVPFSEATPLLLGILLGILFGAQYGGKLGSKTTVTILLLGLAAAFVLGAFPYFSSIIGGSLITVVSEETKLPTPLISFANSYVGGVIGLLIGKLASRRA